MANSNFQGVVNSVIGSTDFSRALMTNLSDALQVEQLRVVGQAQAEALLENTAALIKNTAARSATGGAGSTAGGGAGGVLKIMGGGLLGPLVSGLIGLFGGGKTEAPPPLVAYAPPAAVNYEAGFSRTQPASTPVPPYSSPANAPQITVQVQAMDSRSFLDHREEIARAVREAMLNSHALNDVVSEL